MPLPFLAIATGAINIGKKLFKGIKARQAVKKAKRAAKQEKKDKAIADFEASLKGAAGSTPITESGNILAGVKGMLGGNESTDQNIPDDGPDRVDQNPFDFFKTPMGLLIGVVLAWLIAKAFKWIK